jgi:hypothetical protein
MRRVLPRLSAIDPRSAGDVRLADLMWTERAKRWLDRS